MPLTLSLRRSRSVLNRKFSLPPLFHDDGYVMKSGRKEHSRVAPQSVTTNNDEYLVFLWAGIFIA